MAGQQAAPGEPQRIEFRGDRTRRAERAQRRAPRPDDHRVQVAAALDVLNEHAAGEGGGEARHASGIRRQARVPARHRLLPRCVPQPLSQLLLEGVLAAAERLHGRAAEPGPLRLVGGEAERGPQFRQALVRWRKHRPDPQCRGAVPFRGAEHPLGVAFLDGQRHAERREFRHLGGDEHPELGGAEHRPVLVGRREPGRHRRVAAAPVTALHAQQG